MDPSGPKVPTKDDAREAERDEGAELAGVSAGVTDSEDASELVCEPGPCLRYASAKKRIDSSKDVTSSSISWTLMWGLNCARLSTARLPCVAAMTYAGSCPISVATLPHAASTAAIESVRVPS